MDTQTDRQLLSDYAANGEQDAFAHLVKRRIDLVYSAALRQVRDAHLAEDITQAVFVILARKARGVAQSRTPLSAWLLTATHWVALDALRKLARRRNHERKAAAMSQEASEAEESIEEAWAAVAPQLDAALARLSEVDRAAIVLRFIEDKSLREVAAELGVSEAAAKQRVFRAVEKLRRSVGAHGVSVGAIGAAIGAHAAGVSAPAGLAHAATVTALGALPPALAVESLVKGAVWIMAWNKLKLSVVAAIVLLTAAPAAVLTYRWIAPAAIPAPVAQAAPMKPMIAAPAPAVAPAPAAATPADWRARFDVVYRLDDGQILKRIDRPFIPERTRYLDMRNLSGMFDMSQGICVFQFEDGRAEWNHWTAEKPTIEALLRCCAGVPRYKLEMDEFDRMEVLEGDWVIRKDATEEQSVAAIAREVSLARNWTLVFNRRTVERDVFVARGAYKPTVPPIAPDQPPLITLYLDKPGKPNNHSAGDVHALMVSLGETMNTEVIDETDEPKKQGVFWCNDVGAGVTGDFRGKLLKNVTTQTGITFTPARRPCEVWFAIVEKP